jgi:hypothetical protein
MANFDYPERTDIVVLLKQRIAALQAHIGAVQEVR